MYPGFRTGRDRSFRIFGDFEDGVGHGEVLSHGPQVLVVADDLNDLHSGQLARVVP